MKDEKTETFLNFMLKQQTSYNRWIARIWKTRINFVIAAFWEVRW